jgi:potassium-dependent mechanosensitive channel
MNISFRPVHRRDARRARGCWLHALSVLALLAVPVPSYAQILPGLGIPARPEAAETPAESPPAPAEAAAVQLDRIPVRLEQHRDLARRALEAARPNQETATIRAQLGALETRVETLRSTGHLERLERLDLRSLEGGLESLVNLRRSVVAMQATMTQQAEFYTGWLNSIMHAAETWRLTESELAEGEAPAQLRSGIATLRSGLEEARGRLREQLDEVLALQGALADALSIIDDLTAAVQAELARARIALFRAEHPPIWAGNAAAVDLATYPQTWRNDLAAVRGYLLARQGQVWAHFGLLALLIGAFAMLSRQVRQWSAEKPDLADALQVLRHPIAAALILAILAGHPWIYPDAPIVLRELFGLLLLLPLLRVLPGVVTPSLRGALYLVAGLYLLLRAHSLLVGGSGLERYYFLLLGAATAGALAWIFRPDGPGAKLDAGRWWRAAQILARIGLVVLAIALLANVGGLVSLSALLVTGIITSAFTAIVLFAAVVVTRALLLALLQTGPMQRLNLVRWHSAGIDQWIMRILPVIALVVWSIATARMFQVEAMLGGILSSILFSRASIGAVEISLGDVLGFGLAIWIGLSISRFLRLVLSADVYPRVTLPRGVPATVSMLVNYTVLGLAFILAVAAAGIQLDRFALIVGALSVGIGFGLQNIINNFVSGLILAFERPVQAGDTVQLETVFGQISRIGVRSSTVRTFEGAEVIVPNANLISNEVTNWTLSDKRRRMEILVGVAYGTPPRKVLELLLNVAKSNPDVIDTPAPAALFLGFGDSSLDFSVRAWTDNFESFLTIKSDLTVAIHDALYAAGMEIPFPQRDLHLRSVDSAAVARIGAIQAPEVGEGAAARET